MSRLRKEARDRECQVRLPGTCNFDNSTTVLAHYRLSGISGMGYKSPDLIGAWCCSNCHSALDTPKGDQINQALDKLAHAEGVFRTIAILLDEGKI